MPVLAGSVHGVVVHTSSETPSNAPPGERSIGKRTKTLGSSTVW